MNAQNWILRGVMFGFIIGVTLTLLCGVVLASDIEYRTGGIADVTCNSDFSKCWSPCEVKMAEAMKAIRPYIDYGEVLGSIDALYRSPQTRLREEADRLDQRDAALRKWESIYQECVK